MTQPPSRRQGRPPALDPEDATTETITVRVSPAMLKLVEDAAAREGMARGAWGREAFAEKLGYVDTARRQAPRKRNKERSEEEKP